MRQTHIETYMLALKNKVEGMEKVTVEVTTLTNKAAGAGMAGRWLLRTGIALVSFAGWIAAAYTQMTGKPPP